MAGRLSVRAVDPPASVSERFGSWTWTPAWSYEGAITAWRLSSPIGEVRFLKVRAIGEEPTLAAEAVRLRWAAGHLPVPPVVDAGTEDGVDWLLLEGLAGRDAMSPDLRAEPAALVDTLAAGLRRFHQAPVDACPFRLTVDDAVATVRRRVVDGVATPEDLHPEFRNLSLDEAVRTIERLAPTDVDPVVCHGDYCFPNVLIEDSRVSAYLDLGELAVADRWWDLAVASWSTTWNIGPGWEQRFLTGYGVAPDERRMTFWRLVYDLIS